MNRINESAFESRTTFSYRLTRRTKSNKRWESPLAGYLFISPWLLGFFLLTLWPMIQSLYFSFTQYSLLSPPQWVGLSNYHKIFFSDQDFAKSLKVTMGFVFVSVPLKLVVALFVALLLNQKIKGIAFYRTALYIPSLIGSSIAVAILWGNIFGRDGLVNQCLSLIGVSGKNWIDTPETALGTLVVLVVWQFGSSMIVFLAGLKQIPQELYEASAVDGASKIKQFFSITLPMLTPVILFNLILQTITAFQTFTQAFVITKGGPMESTYMFTLYLYDKAFGRLEMGYASALAWVFLLVIAVVTAILFATSRFWVYYEEGEKRR